MRPALLVAVFFLAIAPSQAQDTGAPVTNAWRTLTTIDVDAAHALLADNHPAALPEVGDNEFRARLDDAYAIAHARAATVTDYAGYISTLGAFANAMGDGHIWSHPAYLPRFVQWTGLIVGRRGRRWEVVNDEPAIAGADLKGATVLSCDGVPADTLAERTLAFQTVVAVDAMKTLKAGWLLIDDGNPFLERPKTCVFEQDKTRRTLTLGWKRIAFDTLQQRYWTHPYGQAGYGLRQLGPDGYWIAIEQLSPEAQSVIDQVKAKTADIRAAQFVVVDLRGNPGGDDAYGRALAEAIYGEAYVGAILGPSDSAGGCASVFRASDGNIAAVAEQQKKFAAEGETAGAAEYKTALDRMHAAKRDGKGLTGNPACKDPPSAAAPGAKSLMPGKVFVLTDVRCFSSCISTVGFFKKLGAIQIGAETGSDTHYSEVREITLPSGLSTFSTLQAIEPGAPKTMGPYLPNIEYEGDIADTAALEKWVSDKAWTRSSGF